MTHIFISHATADDGFVADLRRGLEGQGLAVWVDSRNLRGGDRLEQEIRQAIADASHCIVVLSPQTVNSPWVRREISQALAAQEARPDYRVIPLLLPGITPAALALWFEREPVAVPIALGAGELALALPRLLAALGRELPSDAEPSPEAAAERVDELLLELRDPWRVEIEGGVMRAQAIASLRLQPADPHLRAIESRRYPVTAPLGPVELNDLRWYLEEFALWPVGVFAQRAAATEADLPGWGQALYAAALGSPAAQGALTAWQQGRGDIRRFSVLVDAELAEGASAEQKAESHAAATELLAQPWELLHDGDAESERAGGFLLHAAKAVRVRRRLPNRTQQSVTPAQPPIRILLLSPRPEKTAEGGAVGYIDHRASALPLVQAVENLGELARLTVLHPPTLPSLEAELRRAKAAGTAYHVLHFDGHGVYDRRRGLGALLFESPQDQALLGQRRSDLVHADRLAAIIRQHAIPLVFLEACQSAQSEEDLRSVATRLLEEGVSSVVAMSYSVLVESARRFVQAFYASLAQGQPVGGAMQSGQTALAVDSYRLDVMGAGSLYMQDWFVPVLFQDVADPRLFTRLPPAAAQRLQARQAALRLGDLPETPPQSFVGRSHELLSLERLLAQEPYALVRGSGGAGKSTLAVEAAAWLVRSGRFRRAAFVSLEEWQDERAVLDALARQLLPDGDKYSVAQFPTLDAALQPVERALRDDLTLIVIDNVESVLAAPNSGFRAGELTTEYTEYTENTEMSSVYSVSSVVSILSLCQRLLEADPATRLIFTSRERLPAPFGRGRCTLELGRLHSDDAIRLVERVLAAEGKQPPPAEPGNTPAGISALVEAVDGHARALVLLARLLPEGHFEKLGADLHTALAELERRHPGERENSLYASVELSLRRLPPTLRQRVDRLAVFHNGGHVANLGAVMGVDQATAQQIAGALIDVGLGDDRGYGYLRLDPALPGYLAARLDVPALDELRGRWAAALMQLVAFLYQQRFQDTQLAAQLTLLELPNLLALLGWLGGELEREQIEPEQVVDVAGRIEQLLQNLARAVALRRDAAKKLGGWSRAQFQNQAQNIERLLAQGDLTAALGSAESLHQRALAAGTDAYAGAEYDIAMAHWLLGRALKNGGQAAAALPPLAEAQRRFQTLADGGDRAAARMASAALTEQGDCLTALGRLDEAAACYAEGIQRAEALDDRRGVAVKKGQLGTVRMYQQRYAEALTAHDEARRIFTELGEPREVAGAWHQMGRVHSEEKQWEAAERAYRRGLSIRVQHKLQGDQAASLNELGNLFDATGRSEEAVVAYRQAADIYVALGDQALEGRVRNNIANVLVKLGRLGEARREIQRAIECKQPFGHAAQPWTAWDILRDIEVAEGKRAAAAAAWQQARDAYLAYRREGGYAQFGGGRFVAAVLQLLQEGKQNEAAQLIGAVESAAEATASLRKLAGAVRQILSGAGDPALAEDSALDYDHSAELLLLLERL